MVNFLKYANFHFLHSLQSKSACSRIISSRSLEWLWRYWKFLISNMAAAGHFKFVKYANLRICTKFHHDRLNGCRDIAHFRFPIWRPPAILNFVNMQILAFRTVCSQNMPICTKFCRDRLNSCGDITIFLFSIWRPSAILNFWSRQIFTFCAVYNGNLQNFISIGRTAGELLQMKYFQYVGRPPSWIRCTHMRAHPRCRIGGPKKPYKCRRNPLGSIWDIANFPFLSFGWGSSIHT